MSVLSIGIEKGKEEGRAEGVLRGKAESILVILAQLGAVSESLKTRILEETNSEILSAWTVKAANSASLAEFEHDMKQGNNAETDMK